MCRIPMSSPFAFSVQAAVLMGRNRAWRPVRQADCETRQFAAAMLE